MAVEFKQVGSTLSMKISGEMDMVIAKKVQPQIDRKLAEKNIKNLIINMEKVTFIDSSGLGVIISSYRKIKTTKGRIYVVGASPAIKRILLLSGVNKLVQVYKHEQDIINI